MFTLDESIKDVLKTDENSDFSKIKLVKSIPICPIKNFIDPDFKKELSDAFSYVEEIIKRAEKEFEFAGFSIDKKCESNLLKSIKEFDKTNKSYTPIDIIEIEKYHKNKIRMQANYDVVPDADIKRFYTIIYRDIYQAILQGYTYVDMIIRMIDGRFIDIVIFGYKTRFAKGKIFANFLVVSPNPLDLASPIILHQIKFEPSWFGNPK